MYKRSCLADAHLHWREGHRNCYCWSLKTVCAGLRRQESCGERSVLQTLLHSAALLHEKLPLVSVFLSSTETPEEKQLAVNWLHVRSHTYIIYLVDLPDEYSGAVLHFSCVLAYNFCGLEQASVFRATVFAFVSGPNDRPLIA